MRHGLITLISAAGLLLALGGRVATAAPATLTFGIVPQQSAAKLAETWTPLLNELSRSTGYNIRFATARDIPTFEKRLAAGEYDLAYMNPYHYTVFSIKPGYRAFAKEAGTRLKGVIVVRKDAPYKQIGELANQTLAFPAPAAFAATILPLAHFAGQNIPITAKYVASHESVYLGVAQGYYPAGGGVQRTFDAMPPEVKDQLTILWTTPGFTPHAFAAHPRVKRAAQDKILAALSTLSSTEQGRSLLAGISFKGIEAAKDKEWDDIRTLRIEKLANLLESKD